LYADLLDDNQQPIRSVEFGQTVSVVIYFDTDIEAQITCNYYVADEKKNFIMGCNPRLVGNEMLMSKAYGRYVATYRTTIPLKAGNYSVNLELGRPIVLDETSEFLDVIDNAIVFQVERRPKARLWAQVYIETEYQCREFEILTSSGSTSAGIKRE
jgi:lipopolysaccharide transport system ATP-binding protein